MKKTFLLTCIALMSVCQMLASDNYRNHRYNEFKGLSVNEESIVFVGNSITDMHNWAEAFGNDPRIVSRGVSGGFSFEVLANMYNWVYGHPAKVFIKIGTNDLNGYGTPQTIAQNVEKTVAFTTKESPKTEIYIQSILPCNNGNRSDASIREANTLLKAMCDKYEKATFIDLYSKMGAVAQGFPYGCPDRLHVAAAGYSIWCHEIEKYVGIPTVYPEAATVASIQKTMSMNDVHGGRVSDFSVQPTYADDIIFMGDGFVQSGEWHELLPGSKVKNHGTGWEIAQGNATTTNAIIDASLSANTGITREMPKAVLLYAGSTGYNATNYEAFITKIHGYGNDIKVYCVSLLPNISGYATANSSIKSICDKTANCEYIDVATTLASKTSDKEYFNYGHPQYMTYVTVAQQIAAQATDLHLTALTSEQAHFNFGMAEAMAAIDKCQAGTGVGQFPQSKIDAVKEAIANRASNLAEIVADFAASLNLPTADNVAGKHFLFQTPNRGNRYAIAGNGTMDRADEYNNYATYRWVLEPRQDGSFDIKNLSTGTYADPTTAYNGHMTLTATAPQKGWNFKVSNSFATYAIYSEAAELNMSNNSNMWVYNWYDKNGSYPDLNDTGCQFTINEVEGDPEDPETETIDKKRVYTIHAIFESGATPRYLVNNDGTLAAVTEAPTTEAGHWMIGDDYVMSVADNKYLGVNSGFTLNTNKATIAISDGLTEGAKTIGEVAGTKVRNGAINSNGTIAGGQFTDGKYNEAKGWSTDLVFERVYPDPSKVSIRLDGTELYFTTIEVIDNDKTTYSLSAEAEPFILEEVEGGYTIKSAKTEKYAGYGHTNSWDFSNDADTWRIENIEGEPTTIYQLNVSKGFGADKQEEAAGVYTDKTGQKWVIEPYKENPEPEPEPVLNIVVDKEHGNLYRDGSTTGQSWNNTWKSKTVPQLVFSASANNMTWDGNNVQIESGQAGSSAYTLTAPAGYIIKSLSFDFAAKTAGKTVTLATLQQNYTTSTTPQTISREDYGRKSFNFSVTGTNGNSTILTNFVVEIEEGEEPEDLSGYKVFDNANSTVPYRIPAVAKNQDGDLIFVTDYRYSKQDIGVVNNGKLDLRYRIKYADGTWSEVMDLAKCIESPVFTSFGDPCIVADRESNRVMVTSCCGNVSFPNGTHANHQGWARFYSEDGGKTWGTHTDISEQVFTQLDKRNDGQIRCFFIGSGKISQSATVKVGDYYRLYCAALVKTNGGTNVNYVFYSDDFGQNWNLLGDANDCPIPSGADEPKADELPDGSILVSSRVGNGRYFNIYHFTDVKTGAGSWGERSFSSSSNNGVVASSNACNGEIMIVPVVRNADKVETHLLLQSVPFGPGTRSNVGINYKDLTDKASYATPAAIAADWTGRYQVSMSTSAYSTMCLDKGNNLAFFYEENNYNMGYDMIYKTLSIDEITDNKYSFLTEDPDAISTIAMPQSSKTGVYDLQGRRVSPVTSGLYIEAGRKVMR